MTGVQTCALPISLTLRHTRHNNRPLHEGAHEVLKHVARLWGFGVQLDSVEASGAVQKQLAVPAPAPSQH